ncbi:MAG: sugar ABC transporter permease [Lachnospiraceae bacterium]|jgi:putative aldouronate transport system permease protein|nr:ABC transporter permease subunit [uncultured Acetatifactor sp.]MCI9218463.1 sugar ABC transporter permease [Lachnospiraceae bacterium]
MKQKKSLGTIMKSEWQLHVMLLPAIILLIIFAYLPMVGIVISFQDFVPSGGMKGFFTSQWVGLDNFRYVFGMKDFQQVLTNTLVIAILKIIAGIAVPLVLALMLNEVGNRAFKKATQTIVYVPYFLSWVVLGGILVDILSPSSGIVNTLITALGHEPVYFLGNPNTIRGTLVVSEVWKGCGYNMVIFLAALTGIDQSQYEAAKVDGAGYFKQMLYITLPGILPQIILVAVLGLGNILNAGFDQVFNLYSPIVYEKADIIDTFVYRLGMLNLQYSVSTAVGLFKSVISFILITISFTLAKKYANYQIF